MNERAEEQAANDSNNASALYHTSWPPRGLSSAVVRPLWVCVFRREWSWGLAPRDCAWVSAVPITLVFRAPWQEPVASVLHDLLGSGAENTCSAHSTDGKVRLREAPVSLALGHSAPKWRSWDLNLAQMLLEGGRGLGLDLRATSEDPSG